MATPSKRTGNSFSNDKSVLIVLLELVYFIVLLVPTIFRAFVQKLWPPKSKSLEGLVVIVTGAGGGLGRELALGFAHHGAVVACVDTGREAALDTAEEIVRDGEKARTRFFRSRYIETQQYSKAYHIDVTRPEQIADLSAAVAKDLGPVDILVNNFCSFHSQAVEDTSDSTTRVVTDFNFLSHVRMVREFLPKMKQRGAGHIVTVSSMAGHSALAGAALYTGTTWAVNGFMESVRLEALLQGYEDIHFTIVSAAIMDSSFSKSYSLNAIQRLGTRLADQVAVSTISGVRRNQVHVNIPEQIYCMCIMAKLLPTPVVNWGLQLLSVRPKPTHKTT